MDMKWPQPNMDFYKKATDPFNEIEVQNSGVLETDFFKYANNFYEAAIVIVNKLIGSESKDTGINKNPITADDSSAALKQAQDNMRESASKDEKLLKQAQLNQQVKSTGFLEIFLQI